MKPIVFRIDPNVLSQFVKPSGQKKETVSQINQVQDCLKQLNIDDDEEVEQFTNQQPSQPVIKNRSRTLYSNGSTLPETLSKNSNQQIQEMNLSISGSSLGWDEVFSSTMPTSFQMFQFKNKRRYEPQQQTTQFQIQLQNIPKDNRTTLMIKNIPNKYSQPLLLEEIDCNNRDTYNFFYLPIDFTNKCNVGYAFINFYDPQDIPKFYLEFHNRKWSKFNSEKICQITYARIQGVEELQGHFQYSTIMHEKDRRLKPIFKQSSEQKLKRK
ncbi:unnamed protein product [Paramecium primaurelia]|uniref:Mei2-like C-terminal RNA recognition motif domain-containing protein n=1 Tax=Paramecium primaurelia TaxID=5886 RepID=A0A8S1Q0D1_PARPR|nr:unnamed protein product [Paramecium primaurelia]